MDLFDPLESDFMLYDAIGSVFITGDFNSRVGERIDYIPFDYVNTYIDADDYVPDKTLSNASRDKVCNAFGVSRLLDICKSNCIRVVNGRLCDDCNKGEFTFISRNGSSVID